MNKLKFIKSTLLITLGVVLLGSCMKSEEPGEPTPMATIGFFNAYSPLESTRVRSNESVIGTLPYGTYSDLLYWTTLGQQRIAFLHKDYPSVNQIIAEQEVNISQDKLYSAFAYGLENEAKFLLTEEVLPEQTDTKPKVRFFNLANETGEVNVSFGEDPVTAFSNRDQETTATALTSKLFISTDKTGATNIVVKDINGNELARLNNFDLRASTYSTIILVGDPGDENDEEDKGSYAIKSYVW